MTDTETTKRNKETVAAFVKSVLSTGDTSLTERFIAPGFVDHQPWPGHPADVAGFNAGLAEMRRSFPDLRAEVVELSAEGDLVTALFHLSGTHLGPFMGQAPTGRTFRVTALDLLRMREGRVVEHWGFMDTEVMTRQLGLAPPG